MHTLSVRRLAGADLQVLGGQAHRALDAEVLGLGALNELRADLLERLNLAAGESDANLVNFLQKLECLSAEPGYVTYGALAEVALLFVRHVVRRWS